MSPDTDKDSARRAMRTASTAQCALGSPPCPRLPMAQGLFALEPGEAWLLAPTPRPCFTAETTSRPEPAVALASAALAGPDEVFVLTLFFFALAAAAVRIDSDTTAFAPGVARPAVAVPSSVG